jgi:hypothetical protein
MEKETAAIQRPDSIRRVYSIFGMNGIGMQNWLSRALGNTILPSNE